MFAIFLVVKTIISKMDKILYINKQIIEIKLRQVILLKYPEFNITLQHLGIVLIHLH